MEFRTKQAQGQSSLPPSSLPTQPSSCFHPAPPNAPCSPSFFLFLLHPTYPVCFNLWQMMVGWHQNGATGRETAYTMHSSDKQRETQSDFLLCCSSAPYSSVDCSVELNAHHRLLMTLVYLCNICSVNSFLVACRHYTKGLKFGNISDFR